MRNGFMYEIVNKINNKKYIGITYQNPPTKRWISHKTIAKRKKSNAYLYNAINKYGVENFEFNVIMRDVREDFLELLEKMWIKELNLQNSDYGYNLADGGKVNKGYKIPKDIVEKHRQEMIGERNPFYGKHHTEKTKQQISNAHKGKKHSEEVKRKFSEMRKGKNSPNYGKKGELNPLYGRKRSKEVCDKISKGRKNKVKIIMLDKDTEKELMKFDSINDAIKWIKENTEYKNGKMKSMNSSISKVAKKNGNLYGYKWRRLEQG